MATKEFKALAYDGAMLLANADYNVCRDSPTPREAFFDRTSMPVGQWISPANRPEIARSYLIFDTSELETLIPVGATIRRSYIIFGTAGTIADHLFQVVAQKGLSEEYPHVPVDSYVDYDRTKYEGNLGKLEPTVLGGMIFFPAGSILELNADGISQIKREGYTKFCLRSTDDIEGNPTYPESPHNGLVQLETYESGNPAKLIVEWLEPAPPPPEYVLTLTSSGGGTTNPAPSVYSYPSNESVVIDAISNVGYFFDHWELDGVFAGSDLRYALTMTKNYSLYAVFKKEEEEPEPPPRACLIAAMLIPLGLSYLLPFIRMFRDHFLPNSIQQLYYLISAFLLRF